MKIDKRITLFFIIFLTSFNFTFAQKKAMPTADQLLKIALIKAKKEQKQVLLIFYAVYNPWSAVMRKTINNTQIKTVLSKSFVICQINARENDKLKKLENPGGEILQSKYYDKAGLSSETRAFPSSFVLNQNGKRLGQFIGFPEETEGAVEMNEMLSKNPKFSSADANFLAEQFYSVYKKVAVPSVREVLKEAINTATKAQKKILVIFNASWCHWCHVLDTAIAHPLAKPFFEKHFVIRHFVAHESDQYLLNQNTGSEALLKKYQGDKRSGIPFSIIFDADGKWLADYNGFPEAASADYKEFDDFLKKTTHATDEDLLKVKEAFKVVGKKNGQ